MSFDSSVDAFLYYLGCGGSFYSYLELYDDYIWMSDIERVWREHGCPVLVYDMLTVKVNFYNTTCGWPLSYWDYSVVDLVRGFSDSGSRNSSNWRWRTCLGIRGDYNEDGADIESFLRKLRGYLDYGFTVGLFSALYVLGGIVVRDVSSIKFKVELKRYGSNPLVSTWFYSLSGGVQGLKSMIKDDWILKYFYNDTICGGIYRYLFRDKLSTF